MNAESHKAAIRESLEIIRECIQKGIERRQRTIGFHCSAAAADMLELYLHSQNLIDPGTMIKHDFFSSERQANERLPIGFQNRIRIISLLVEIEKKRNLLCYGKPQPREVIQEAIELFNKLRKAFDEMGVDYE